ncbi:MAG: pectin acetylesterase-family hydrolase [Halioglobus sp.]
MINSIATARIGLLNSVKPLLALCLSAVLAACSDGGDNARGGAEPFAELFDQGVGRYLGVYTPMLAETNGDVVQHSFGAGDGPLCLEGAPYSMATRATGADELLIFLEGGGACWSDLCLATTEVTPGISGAGINDPMRENNPMRGWNQVYVPYCDGSLHAGDIDVDTDGDGNADRFHRGLHNLSAALDVAVSTFPAPGRIVIAGNSGGGLGTIFALPLVRSLYPDVQIDVINDSGVGVAKPGDPSFLRGLLREWNTEAFVPASCPDCIGADGHLTEYLIWQMDQDTTVRRAMLSYTQDSVFADTFLQIGGAAFEAALLGEMQQQRDAHPGRTQTFLPAGSGHTFVQIEPDKTAGGVNLMDWLGFMLAGSDQWASVDDRGN